MELLKINLNSFFYLLFSRLGVCLRPANDAFAFRLTLGIVFFALAVLFFTLFSVLFLMDLIAFRVPLALVVMVLVVLGAARGSCLAVCFTATNVSPAAL